MNVGALIPPQFKTDVQNYTQRMMDEKGYGTVKVSVEFVFVAGLLRQVNRTITWLEQNKKCKNIDILNIVD